MYQDITLGLYNECFKRDLGKKLRRIKTINEVHEETLRDKGTFNGVG